MPTREEMLKWGTGERIVGLPGNAEPGARTEVAAKTKEELAAEQRRIEHAKVLAERQAAAKAERARAEVERTKEDLGFKIEHEIRGEKIRLVVQKSRRSADIVFGFGKHKGEYLKSKAVPRDYVQWLRKKYLPENISPVLQAVVDSVLDRKPVELPAEYVPVEWGSGVPIAVVPAAPAVPFKMEPEVLDVEVKAGVTALSSRFDVKINSDAGGLLPAEEACGKLVHEINRRAAKYGFRIEANFKPRDRSIAVEIKRSPEEIVSMLFETSEESAP